jgi:hypothetical protein
LIEKLARGPSPSKSEAKTNEEPEASNREDNETSTDPNDFEQTEEVQKPDDEEQQESQPPLESSSPPPPPAIPSPPPLTTETPREDLRDLGPVDEKTQVEPVEEITPDHPEVKKAVEQAVEDARNAAVNIPADVYAELMHKAIQTVEQEQQERDPQGPL